MVWIVYDDKGGVCSYKKVGFGGWGGGAWVLAKSRYRGGRVHRLINDACWMSYFPLI